MFYILFIALIIYRWIFISMEPAKRTPPYWINMGALAITTLAGARLILSYKSWEILSIRANADDSLIGFGVISLF
jgi:hypothetical protein